MSSKARRNRPRTSGNPEEVEARTGVKPAPGSVVSRKNRDLIRENHATATVKAVEADKAMRVGNYAAAGKLFKEASDAANLANAHKMKSLYVRGQS